MNVFNHPQTWAALLTIAAISTTAIAQPSSQPSQAPALTLSMAKTSLRDALESAWQKHPFLRSEANRKAEIAGRKLQTQGFISAPPTLGLVHSTDLIGSNNGLRGLEAELSAPLWNRGLRSATQSQIERDEQRLALAGLAAKLKLAGELRELAAKYALVLADQTLAKRKVAEASALADDVSRRVRAGDVARVDHLMAQSAVAQANAQLEAAQVELLSLKSQWQALTALSTEPSPLTMSSSPVQGEPAADLQNHPQLLEAQAVVNAAQAKLNATLADSRDPMEVGVSAAREKSARGSPAETSMKFLLRIPFGGASRNDAKAAAARAELDEAQTALDAAQRQIAAELTAAKAQLAASERQLLLAGQRAKIATEAQSLYAKAFRLGESDLLTRLRADNEKFDAELAQSRAQLQVQRAQSQLQQAQGFLP
jgi:cobalt-zinc-cadmium efflux system outer membrane protein